MAFRKRPTEPDLLLRLRRHLGADPATMPVVEKKFGTQDRPNLHLAVEEILARPSAKAERLGVVALEEHAGLDLGRLSREASARHFAAGPIQLTDLSLPGGRQLACVKTGLYLIRLEAGPLGLLVTEPRFEHPPTIRVEVMAPSRELAEGFARELESHTRRGKAYRGHVISIESDCYGRTHVQGHAPPSIAREDLILPEALLQRIERHTLSFSRHAGRLREAGRHLKRGILLYGRPGTGKTLTAMYLLSQMPGRTAFLITGRAVGSIEAACNMARLLEPSTVVLEDVDLIGTERENQEIGANALLFELLNQMDGLAGDVDVLFILTTNRPDVLEPALAARPGRVDQAIEVPPPDEDCRRRLFALYGRGLELEVTDWNRLIERTAGVSGAFIRELLRKAAVFAAEEGKPGALVVRDDHLQEGLAELLVAGGPLTKSLLGATAAGSA